MTVQLYKRHYGNAWVNNLSCDAVRIARSVSFMGDLQIHSDNAAAIIRTLPSGAIEVTPNGTRCLFDQIIMVMYALMLNIASNTFCREWAQALLLCHGGPIKLRRMMEAYKQKVYITEY